MQFSPATLRFLDVKLVMFLLSFKTQGLRVPRAVTVSLRSLRFETRNGSVMIIGRRVAYHNTRNDYPEILTCYKKSWKPCGNKEVLCIEPMWWTLKTIYIHIFYVDIYGQTYNTSSSSLIPPTAGYRRSHTMGGLYIVPMRTLCELRFSHTSLNCLIDVCRFKHTCLITNYD